MNWPHDPDGMEGSEGGRKYGTAIFAKKVEAGEDFPLKFEEFVISHGEDPIRIDFETVVPAKEILDLVSEEKVDDIVAFHRAIGSAIRSGDFAQYRENN